MAVDLASAARAARALREHAVVARLAVFVRAAWHVLEPGVRLEWAPYLDLLCRELEAVTAGDIRDLLICVPPGAMKSLLVSVFWPAWWWLRDPGVRYLTLANDDALATRDSRRMRELVRSDWYAALVRREAALGRVPAWTLAPDQQAKVNYETTARGARQCLSTGARITGKRGDVLILDDPHDAKDVILGSPEQVRVRLDDVAHVVEEVLPTRVNDARTARRVTIMQRLHEDDTAGRFLSRGVGRAVVLPLRYEPDHPHVCPDDPRSTPGELLHPGRWPEEIAAALEARLGPRQAAGQLQQRPVAAEGGLYRRAWFEHRFAEHPRRVWRDAERRAVSIDAAFKGGRGSDFVVLAFLARDGGRVRVCHVIRERMDYPTMKAVLTAALIDWPHPTEIVVEDKANGSALIAELRSEWPQVVAFTPRESKHARAQATAPMWEAGSVELPERASWAPLLIEEHVGFPRAAHDDQVDAVSQMLIRWFLGDDLSAFLWIA